MGEKFVLAGVSFQDVGKFDLLDVVSVGGPAVVAFLEGIQNRFGPAELPAKTQTIDFKGRPESKGLVEFQQNSPCLLPLRGDQCGYACTLEVGVLLPWLTQRGLKRVENPLTTVSWKVTRHADHCSQNRGLPEG